ncbi:MAG: heavy-metal-associated domain-containing protein [Candidatus Marinimicrobia bacterium]|nr:heavy-metal-associated domain-containing protein [Candidatus Neomarinimicrobiota bacterium]
MKKNKIQKRTLLGIALIILALVIFPYYNGVLFGGDPLENDSKGVVSEWSIEGMTCQGCARGLQGGMAAVKGVVSCQVDYKTNSMVCTYNDKVLNSEKVAEHVAKMGYKAIPKQKETEKPISTS